MPRFRWQWRGGTYQNGPIGLTRHAGLPNEIEIIDGKDGTQYAITDDVQKAERIVACLNYGEQIAKTV